MWASRRGCLELSSPYGTAMRAIGAWRWMYQPFCSRSARNSSSFSVPARLRSSWSRNCAARWWTKWRSKSVYWYMSVDDLQASGDERHAQQRADQAVGELAGQLGADPDAGQGPDQQGAQQRPVDIAECRVADAGDQRQRHRMGDVGAHQPPRLEA